MGRVTATAVQRLGQRRVHQRPAAQLYAGGSVGLPRTAPVQCVQGGQEDVQVIPVSAVAQIPGAAPQAFPGHAVVQEDHVTGGVPVRVDGHEPLRLQHGPEHYTAARLQVQPVRGVQPHGHADRRTLHCHVQAPGHRRLEFLQRQFRIPDHVVRETHQQRGVYTVLRGRELLITRQNQVLRVAVYILFLISVHRSRLDIKLYNTYYVMYIKVYHIIIIYL